MILRVLFILFFTQFLYAQTPLPTLFDSLAQSNSDNEKSRLSMIIASQLAKDDWQRALHYIELAEKSALSSRSEKVKADYYNAVAEIYSEKDALDITLENFVKAYKYYQHRPLKERYRLENDLAIAYSETENYEKALKIYHKIYKYDHTQKNPKNLAAVSNNIGMAWRSKNLDSSFYYFNNSLQLLEGIEYPYLKFLIYTNLAKSYLIKDEDETAKHYFHRAINEIGPNNINSDLGWVYGEFSELYLKNEKIDSAIYYSKNAVAILDSLAPFTVINRNAVEVLYKAYIKKEDFKNASKNLEKFFAISDSLNIEDRKAKVQKIILEEEYRTKEKIRELEESKSRLNFYILILALVVLLLILGIILYRYRNKLKRTDLEKELFISKQKELNSNLELKNKELIGKAMIELHRTELIEDILKDLKEVRLKASKKETQSAIDFIVKRLKRDTSPNIWDEFELRFKEVHESFYTNLCEKHTDLTPKDKRLCALLKLNLTTKEIAQVMGQSTKSVESARIRLRKKLDITNSQTDLSSYLSNFG